MSTSNIASAAAIVLALSCAVVQGAQLREIRTVDEQVLMVHWLDGEVEYRGDGKGPGALTGREQADGAVIRRYEPVLDIAAATNAGSYSVTSSDDANYTSPQVPSAVFRKTKVNGTNNKWPEADYTVEHTLFLQLPHKLQQGRHYTLTMAPATRSDVRAQPFAFDVYANVTEALHVNLIGYSPAHTAAQSADLYMWLGDGGPRDYSAYAGRKVILQNTVTGEKHEAGTVAFWKPSGADVGGWNLTGSPVWTCDFSAFRQTGTYRLAIEGIGCSPSFEIRQDIYFEPFKTSVRGFFYMRIGAEPNVSPIPRQPRFIPGKDPVDFKVYRTTFGPWHPEWKKGGGDPWDRKDWSAYKEPGEPTNPNAWGGHSDALDWDRHAGHVAIIYDLLLPYFLSNGKIGDDNLGIPESGNGIPDILDEALYEVDFWLRLRDGQGGYAFGLNNPTRDHRTMYQAGARPYMAWANAANCAMAADCLRLAGKTELMARYRDEAIKAWKYANEEDLDFAYGIGNGKTRGRDLKMLAAAFLYNVTGERFYEDAMALESVVASPAAPIDNKDKYCQYWGTAAYLMCDKMQWQPIHHPDLVAKMRSALLDEAMTKNVNPSGQRPSRRSSDNAYGWFQATQMVHPAIILHAVSRDKAQQDMLLRAMLLDADYVQGRNPMNMVQMTGLGSRHVEDIYTSGQNDGVPGVHPGHTPYMNAETWSDGYMADPRWYAKKGYPAWKQWPKGEALWPARYCFANNEFTPQQTMRGKMALLGYLYSLGKL